MRAFVQQDVVNGPALFLSGTLAKLAGDFYLVITRLTRSRENPALPFTFLAYGCVHGVLLLDIDNARQLVIIIHYDGRIRPE